MKPWPQSDKPQGLSGAADVWDANWAGPVLLDDYFPSAAPPADDASAPDAPANGAEANKDEQDPMKALEESLAKEKKK